MLMPDLPGSACADLCAGSGAFGFEMLSRGAATMDFIEENRARCSLIRGNAAAFGVLDRCRFIAADAAAFVRSCSERYDILFFDPPYDEKTLPALVPFLVRLLTPRGRLVYQRRRKRGEVPIDRITPGSPTIKFFGDTAVECFGPEPAPSPEN
jgi:16S rRNA (guanine966-N2)-methyltransferase